MTFLGWAVLFACGLWAAFVVVDVLLREVKS